MKRVLDNWPRFAFIYLPLFLLIANASVLLSEQLQSETDYAIRLVRESNSRKENFTIQQYLYSTVFYRKNRGEAIDIHGWQARSEGHIITVEFRHTDASGHHVALWETNIKEKKVTPINDAARELSWH